jgi:hypothetical protein
VRFEGLTIKGNFRRRQISISNSDGSAELMKLTKCTFKWVNFIACKIYLNKAHFLSLSVTETQLRLVLEKQKYIA